MGLFDRTQEQKVDGVKLLLTVVAAPFYAVGWLVGVLLRLVVFLLGWTAAASKIGFRDGKG